jgi:hypothetical protein
MPTDDALTDAPEFRSEYERSLEQWFRRRFGWLCIAYAAFTAVSLTLLFLTVVVAAMWNEFGHRHPAADLEAGELARLVEAEMREAVEQQQFERAASLRDRLQALEGGGDDGTRSVVPELDDALHPRLFAISGLAATLQLAAVLYFFRRVRPRIETRESALAAASRLILALGGITLLGDLVTRIAVPEVPTAPLSSLAVWHFSACLFLPWTPRESLRPLLPLLIALAAARLFASLVVEGGSPLFALGEAAASPLVLLPGMALSAWRLRRHRRRLGREFVGREFRSLRLELRQARGVHEASFPKPFEEGPIRFDYAYTPARELGGDYLHVSRRPDGGLFLAVIDVTGHGLAAAMTVNRLAGELERIHAERPAAGPGEVLAGLNRYVHLTLAKHSILATAAAVELDPARGIARIANAGHPPILLREPPGRIEAVPAIEPLLGALPPDEFGTEERRIHLAPGSVLLLYTDGAFEARNRAGEELGLDRFRSLLRHHPPPRRWPRFMLSMVEAFEGGVHADDVLVASLSWEGPGDPPAPDPLPSAAAGATA